MIDVNANVLMIYTGGTMGMVQNPQTGALEAFDFDYLTSYVPELQQLNFDVSTIVFDHPVDSSDMTPDHWQQLVKIIEQNYHRYDGFVVLHGTDTMAYAASALSFMIANLKKPVVFTGAQLPIGRLRTDAKENLITALEIAADKDQEGRAVAPEVSVFFQNSLYRGNRVTKIDADNFKAFESFNYPVLAQSGINIRYDRQNILRPDFDKQTQFGYALDTGIAVLKLFPGITRSAVDAILHAEGLKAVVLETYGSGNAPSAKWFSDSLCKCVNNGKVVVNVTQCKIGLVDMQRYNTGCKLLKAGVISGYDLTTEAAITKLMYLLGCNYSREEIEVGMRVSLAGEITRTDN